MLVTIRPAPGGIGGVIAAPPSKSMAHRAVLCAALAVGRSHITHLEFSKDISATLSAAAQLCAAVDTGADDAAGGRSDGYKHSGVILLQFPPGGASGVPLGELARQRLRG